jgi:hypothetical protein
MSQEPKPRLRSALLRFMRRWRNLLPAISTRSRPSFLASCAILVRQNGLRPPKNARSCVTHLTHRYGATTLAPDMLAARWGAPS